MKPKDVRVDTRLVGEGDPRSTATERRDDDRAFTVAVLGDFGSRADGAVDLPARRWRAVDADNFEAVLGKLDVRWTANSPAGSRETAPLALTIASLDDFRPPAIAARLEPVRHLLALRADLDDPARLQRTIDALGMNAPAPSATPPAASSPRSGSVVSPAQLLEQIIGGAESTPAPTLVEGDLGSFVREIVAPYVVKVDKATEARVRDAIDARLSAEIDAVLHDAAFQRLESAWRGLHWFLRRTLGEQSPAIRVLHLPKAQLLLDVIGAESPEASTLGRALIDAASVPGAVRPSLLLGLYDFGCDDHDVVLLHALGAIAAAAGVPFIAAANASLLGCRSFTDLPSADRLRRRWADPALEQWRAVRALPDARWLALAAPRWLCRAPFEEEVDGLRFQEGVDGRRDALLWAHPAWLVAAALAGGRAEGQSIGEVSREVQVIDGLPLYTYEEDGEIVAVPCAEAWMTDAQVQALADGGLTPVVSYRQRDAVALPRLQSVADPTTPLAEATR